MEHCTIYFSSSEKLSQETDLLALLDQSRRNNAKIGVSGILLYVRGSIVQVLEGEEEAVETLYQRIRQDQRHTDVIRVLDRLIPQRLFAEWTMGYETITGRQLDDIKAIVAIGSNEELVGKQSSNGILKMIQAFYEGNRHN